MQGERGEADPALQPSATHAGQNGSVSAASGRVGELSPEKPHRGQGEGEGEMEDGETGERGEEGEAEVRAAEVDSMLADGEQSAAANGQAGFPEQANADAGSEQAADGEGEADTADMQDEAEGEDEEEWAELEEGTFEIRDVLDARYNPNSEDDGTLEYLLDWTGIDPDTGQPWKSTWETHKNVLKPSQSAVDGFWASEKGQQRKREREEQKRQLREKKAAEKRKKEEKKRQKQKRAEEEEYFESQEAQRTFKREYKAAAAQGTKRARANSDDSSKLRTKRRKAAVPASAPRLCDVCNLAQLPFSSPPTSDTVQCAQCGCTVHPACYQPSLPTGEEGWLCNACLFASSASRSLQCCFCGRESGALWPAYSGDAPGAPFDRSSTPPYFAHVCCALTLPAAELSVSPVDTAGFVQRMDSSGKSEATMNDISLRRGAYCAYCEQLPEPYNAPLPCSIGDCQNTFHIPCGRRAGCADRRLQFCDANGELQNAWLQYCVEHRIERDSTYEREAYEARARGEENGSEGEVKEGTHERQPNGQGGAQAVESKEGVGESAELASAVVQKTNGVSHSQPAADKEKGEDTNSERKPKKRRKERTAEQVEEQLKKRTKETKSQADKAEADKPARRKKTAEARVINEPTEETAEESRRDGVTLARASVNCGPHPSTSPVHMASPLSPSSPPAMSPLTTTAAPSSAAIPRIPRKNQPRFGLHATGLPKQTAPLARQTSDPASNSTDAALGRVSPVRQMSADSPSSSPPPPSPPVDPVESFIAEFKHELSSLASLPSTSDLRSVSPAVLTSQLAQLSSTLSDVAAIGRIHAAVATPAQIGHIVAALQLCLRGIRDDSAGGRHKSWVELATQLAILLRALWRVRQWVVEQLRAVNTVVRALREEAGRRSEQGEEWLHLLAYCKKLMAEYEPAKPKDATTALPKHALEHQKGREYYQQKQSYGMGTMADLRHKAQGFRSGSTAPAKPAAPNGAAVAAEQKSTESGDREVKADAARPAAAALDTSDASLSLSPDIEPFSATRPPTPSSASASAPKRVPPIQLPVDHLLAAEPIIPLWPIPKNPLRAAIKRSVSWKNDDELEDVKTFHRDKAELERGPEAEAWRSRGGREELKRQYSKEEGRAMKQREGEALMDGDALSTPSPAANSQRSAPFSSQIASPQSPLSRSDLFPARPTALAAPAVISPVLSPAAAFGAFSSPAISPALEPPGAGSAVWRSAVIPGASTARRGFFPTLPQPASSVSTFPSQPLSPTVSPPAYLPPQYSPPRDGDWAALNSTVPPVDHAALQAEVERQKQATRLRGEEWDRAKLEARAKAREAIIREREREMERQRARDRVRAAEMMRQREAERQLLLQQQMEAERREREREEGEVLESPHVAEPTHLNGRHQQAAVGEQATVPPPPQKQQLLADGGARQQAPGKREESARLWQEKAVRARDQALARHAEAVQRSPLSPVAQSLLALPASPPSVSG